MVNLRKHLDLLGMHVEDRVTGMKGIVASVTFDLYGCIQAIVNPGLDKDGKRRESEWFDVSRLVVTGTNPVMERPVFEWDAASVAEGKKGPAERPLSVRG